MREKPNIPDNQLQTCLQEHYTISVTALHFLPLGLDTNAGVYQVVSAQGPSYLLKAKSGPLYEPCCFAPRYLADQGVTAVVAPLRTKTNALWASLGTWNIIVYPFIDGEAGWNPGMTDDNWQATGTILKQIHSIPLPSKDFPALRKETFDVTEYTHQIHELQKQITDFKDESELESALVSRWKTHQSTIHTMMSLMENLAPLLRENARLEVICHADLHPGNIIRDQSNNVSIIDWDDVMLAPKERDFLFVPDTKAGEQEASPFFLGYGETEINWPALTYYRCERAIQDVIECTKHIFFREDLEEATKAEALQIFDLIFTKDGEADAAFAAYASVPKNTWSQ